MSWSLVADKKASCSEAAKRNAILWLLLKACKPMAPKKLQ